MLYQPVKIMKLFCRVFTKTGEFVKQTPYYFQVRCASIGDCGHKHKTEAAAEPCKERMKKLWTKRRSEQSKAAAQKRRVVA